MELTSLEYANLIAWIASVKHGVNLGKTQLQKLLFMFYGVCFAKFGDPPFRDDTPKAFPFGPVFPRPYKRYIGYPVDLTQKDKDCFMQKPEVLKVAVGIVDEFYKCSATRLSEWSHRDGSPWKEAVYRDNCPAWGREIDADKIKGFFSNPDWKIGI